VAVRSIRISHGCSKIKNCCDRIPRYWARRGFPFATNSRKKKARTDDCPRQIPPSINNIIRYNRQSVRLRPRSPLPAVCVLCFVRYCAEATHQRSDFKLEKKLTWWWLHTPMTSIDIPHVAWKCSHAQPPDSNDGIATKDSTA